MVDNRKIKIYALKHPITLEIRYIGKTNQSLCKRLGNHIYNAKYTKHNKHLSNWILSILKIDMKPIICLIEECSYSIWQEKEKYWISYYSNLINITEGGDGSLGFLHTPETIKKLRNINLGRKHSQEFKDNMSKRLKGKSLSQEHINKISNSTKGKYVSEETKQKLSKSHIGIKQSEESKQKRSDTIKKWWAKRKSIEDIVKS